MLKLNFKATVSIFLISSIFTLSSVGCTSEEASSTEEYHPSAEEISEETSAEKNETLFPSFVFDSPKESDTDLSKKEYTKVSSLPKENIVSKVPEAKSGYTYFNAVKGIFEITGLVDVKKTDGVLTRLPIESGSDYSIENEKLAYMLSGGRVRFVTNAKTFVLYAKMGSVYNLSYFCAKGAYGFDVYTGTGTNRQYIGASGNHLTNDKKVHSIVELGEGYKEVTIILPSYGAVTDLYIGLPNDSSISAPDEYTYNAPICFYGSSITQGASVTRPGVAFPNIVTLALDANCYNLGFSGSAKGEQSIAEYIGSMEISAFVMDYDYNAPDVSHLESTHYNFYKTVRTSHPEIPIILMSHPYYKDASSEDKARTNVVKATYDKAISEGDKNIYFIDSETFFPAEYRSLATVDNLHPNDIGHLYMAQALYPVLKSALENK